MQHRRVVMTFCTTLALATSLTIPLAGQAGALASAMFSSVTDSASLSTPVVVNGTFSDAGGAGVSGGTVVMFAWPANEDQVPEDGSIDLVTLTRATTDSTGRYALRLAPNADLSAVTLPSGDINIELQGFRPDGTLTAVGGSAIPAAAASGTTSTATPEPPDPSGTDTVTDAPGETPTPVPTGPPLSFEPSPSVNALPAGSVQAMTQAGTNATTTLPVTAAQVTLASTENTPTTVIDQNQPMLDPPPRCFAHFVKSLGVKYAVVGETFNEGANFNHTFRYTNGAKTSFQVGIGLDDGHWKADAGYTKERSSTATEHYATYGDGAFVHYRTGWKVGKWFVSCNYYAGSHPEVRVGDYFGGAFTTQSKTGPSAHQCAKYGPGGGLTLDYSTAVTISNSISFTLDGFGVSLGSTTGYSSNSEAYFHNPGRTDQWLCGHGSGPAYHPRFIVAKPYDA
jgi:hypothetical protein